MPRRKLSDTERALWNTITNTSNTAEQTSAKLILSDYLEEYGELVTARAVRWCVRNGVWPWHTDGRWQFVFARHNHALSYFLPSWFRSYWPRQCMTLQFDHELQTRYVVRAVNVSLLLDKLGKTLANICINHS